MIMSNRLKSKIKKDTHTSRHFPPARHADDLLPRTYRFKGDESVIVDGSGGRMPADVSSSGRAHVWTRVFPMHTWRKGCKLSGRGWCSFVLPFASERRKKKINKRRDFFFVACYFQARFVFFDPNSIII